MAHIMIVEDEQALVSILKTILVRQGHEVSVVPTGKAALQALGVEPFDVSPVLPDLVIMDIMPRILDSRTVVLSMEENFRTRMIPLLILAAKSDGRSSLSGMASVAGFFDRRIDPKLLAETVAQILTLKPATARVPAALRIPERAMTMTLAHAF